MVFDLALCSTRPRFARRSGCLGSVLMGGGESELSGAREGGREGEEREEKRKKKKSVADRKSFGSTRCCFLHNDIPAGGIPELGECFPQFFKGGWIRKERNRKRTRADLRRSTRLRFFRFPSQAISELKPLFRVSFKRG